MNSKKKKEKKNPFKYVHRTRMFTKTFTIVKFGVWDYILDFSHLP